MYAITYARSSNGHSVEDQQEILLNALPPEYKIVGSYGDVAPGSSTRLPSLAAASEHLAAGRVQVIYVGSLDRLIRRADQLEAVQRWCSERGFVIQEVPDVPENQ